MNRNGNYRKVKPLIGMFVFLVSMILAGCTSLTSDSMGDFNSKGLPSPKYLVGGGLEIEWMATQAGTAYLVEEKTGKIIMTKSLEAEDEFEFSPGSIEPEETKKIFGVEMSELKFSLYFIPAAKE